MHDVPDGVTRAFRPACSDEIRSWSYGLVEAGPAPQERDWLAIGRRLGSEKTFGPRKAYFCACGKYLGADHAGVICDICGVTVTGPDARRTRCGHISLFEPIAHPLDANLTLEAFPVLPAEWFESDESHAVDLRAAYEQLLEANRVENGVSLRAARDQVTQLVLELLVGALESRAPSAPTIARGAALIPR